MIFACADKRIIGGKFAPHQDGRRLATVDEQSFMTLNMYLNSVRPEYEGATRVLSSSTPSDMHAKRPLKVLAKVTPVLGSAAIFRDTLWHDGEELTGGVKYLLRTDVLYERVVPFDFEVMYRGLDDREKGEKAVEIASGLEDAGNMEEALKWYKKAAKFSSTFGFLHDSMVGDAQEVKCLLTQLVS